MSGSVVNITISLHPVLVEIMTGIAKESGQTFTDWIKGAAYDRMRGELAQRHARVLAASTRTGVADRRVGVRGKATSDRRGRRGKRA